MRVRRMSALFWASCLVVCCFIMYILTDRTFRLPTRKTSNDMDGDNKWVNFENKLKHIEEELNQHHAVVGEIRSVVEQFVDKSSERDEHDIEKENQRSNERQQVIKKLQSPQMTSSTLSTKFDYNRTVCNVQYEDVPAVDVQMLSMYENMNFEDEDGGPWKQGWRIEYDTSQWSHQEKLKVIIVPHSHNDPGWLKTFEEYYRSQTKAIFTNMVAKLAEDTKRKFIWAEISFLSLWWEKDATMEERNLFRGFLASGQLEIVTGGWVMNDEANAHWMSVVQQLTTGHQWLLENLNTVPRVGWAIDPFGHSSSQPYLLKLAGIEASVIQRVHYRVKKELALQKNLEFRWRQAWDGHGGSDFFTHMMPFYSYDVPHSCGPDPKVCCQFDFKRLPGNSVFCPWKVNPRAITDRNVEERSMLLLDQWRKKAQLYQTNVVLYPLGDDFRWDRSKEWDDQFQNYEKLLDYMNLREDLNVEVKFGTLTDYFKAVHSEKEFSEFPVLSGDFFTYADRNQHYWSGYYTSRPFYKHMDRAVLGYVKAAETILAQSVSHLSLGARRMEELAARVHTARQSLSLFQHHDGVTGTARDAVVLDYADKLLRAIQDCQHVIQNVSYHLLGEPEVQNVQSKPVYFDVDELWRQRSALPEQMIVTVDQLAPARRIVLYNALTFTRHEPVNILVSYAYVKILDSSGAEVPCQISPVVLSEAAVSTNKFQVSFIAITPALSLTTYVVAYEGEPASSATYATLRIYNTDFADPKLPSEFPVDVPSTKQSAEFPMRLQGHAGGDKRVVFQPNGLLKAVCLDGHSLHPLHLDFFGYGSQTGSDSNSGAYLFMPDGDAKLVRQKETPVMAVIEGPIMSRLQLNLMHAKHIVTLYNNPSKPDAELEVTNIVDVSHNDDFELSMRLSTNIKNKDVFYTDLNGMQMIKRRYLSKLPLQANFYPLPSAAYLEDGGARLTVLTSTPLGVAALAPGQIEIIQDRHLSKDDNRGLNQGVWDNVPTLHTYRLLLEEAVDTECHHTIAAEHPSGRLTLAAHVASQSLLQPLVRMLYSAGAHDRGRPPAPHREFRPLTEEPGAEVVMASYRTDLLAQYTGSKQYWRGSGLVVQRSFPELCYGDPNIRKHYPLGNGQMKLSELLRPKAEEAVFLSGLTQTQVGRRLSQDEVRSFALCPQEVRSVFINHTQFLMRQPHY